MTSKLQMTADDIYEVYKAGNGLNLPLLKEATRQVELKVQDEHNRKERIDARAYTLLTILLSLISIIFGSIASGYLKYPWLLGLTCLILVASTMYLFQTLKPRAYAASGTFPHAWLTKEYIKSYQSKAVDNDIIGLALARLLYDQESNIRIGDDSSNKRLRLLEKALTISQCSFLPMIISLILEIYSRF